MLNTHKLLYILPDLAYVAELLPAKKPNTFAVQSFRQINGEFLDDNEFIAANVLKLFTKLDKEDYHLILPDFLFTNTIVNVKETGDNKVKKYLTEKLLPSLSLSDETHEIETFILTELKGESRVQLSAIEKSVLGPIRVGAHQSGVKITGISPISWVIKSVVSLEPSVSVLQIGDTLYGALQYIGVDQTTQAPVAEIDAIAETIKTLKGAEPNIQTIYLLSNTLVETKLKELASDTIPIQQLNSLREDEAQMPSYVKDIIEYSMRTLSLTDYPVPTFALGKPTSDEIEALKSGESAKTEHAETAEKAAQSAPAKHQPHDDPPAPDKHESDKASKAEVLDEPETAAEILPPLPQITTTVTTTIRPPAALDATPLADEERVDAAAAEETPAESSQPSGSLDTDSDGVSESEKMAPAESTTEESVAEDSAAEPDEVDLRKFASVAHDAVTPTTEISVTQPDAPASPVHSANPLASTKPKSVIKNSSGVAPMLKMVFITLVVFAITVAVGIGVGLGLLQLNNKNTADTSPVVVSDPSPAAVASPVPSPSPKPKLDKAAVSVLVVNATTRAGYAGTIKELLTKDGFSQVTTGNAKGEYDGNSLLLDEENDSLAQTLESAADLDKLTTYASDSAHPKKTEDASGKYDAVLVLGE